MLVGASFTRSRRGIVLHRRIFDLLISVMVKSLLKVFLLVKGVCRCRKRWDKIGREIH